MTKKYNPVIENEWQDKINKLCDEASELNEYHTILSIMVNFPLYELVKECFEERLIDFDLDKGVTIQDLKECLCNRIDNLVSDLKEEKEHE